MAAILDREEYIEQAYFFHMLRERMAQNMPAQDVLARVHEEILATTRLPLAIQFLATELKHTGLLSSGFARLTHYFTPFQAFVIRQTEQEGMRINMETALLVLEREAAYRSGKPTVPGASGVAIVNTAARVTGPRLAILDEEGEPSMVFTLDRGEAVIGRGDADIKFEFDVYLTPLHARVGL